MSYVLIYGGLRLDLDDGAMRELGLRPGQHVPNDMVGACIRAQARQVCAWNEQTGGHQDLRTLADWAFADTDKPRNRD